MSSLLRRFFMSSVVLIIVLVGSGVLQPSIHVQAASVTPGMVVTLESRGNTYTAMVYDGIAVAFHAKVNNTGNLSLQVVANLDVPQGWVVNEKYDDCSNLATGNTCTFTWAFTPNGSGQVYLRVYVRGIYTDSSGNTSRITQSPAFLFNVKPSEQAQSQVSTGTATLASNTGVTTYVNPNMAVTLITNDLYTYAATVYADKTLIFRAQVKNTGSVPLQVVANLDVPQGWDVDQNTYSDCPTSLGHKDTCTISWYFTPQGSGQVYLRVYVRGFYTDSWGDNSRITQSPVFIFNVKPPKG